MNSLRIREAVLIGSWANETDDRRFYKVDVYSLNTKVSSSFCSFSIDPSSPNERFLVERPTSFQDSPSSPGHYAAIKNWEEEAEENDH